MKELSNNNKFNSSQYRLAYAPIFGLGINELIGVDVHLEKIDSGSGCYELHALNHMQLKHMQRSEIQSVQDFISNTVQRDLYDVGKFSLQVLMPNTSSLDLSLSKKSMLRLRCNAALGFLDDIHDLRLDMLTTACTRPSICFSADWMFARMSHSLEQDIHALTHAGIRVIIDKVDAAWMLKPLHELAIDGLSGKVLGASRTAHDLHQLIKTEKNRDTQILAIPLPPKRAAHRRNYSGFQHNAVY